MVGRLMTHAGTCPISVGTDRALDDDAEWFRQHPGATFRTRPVTWAEAAEIEITWGWRPTGNVIVRQLAPGLRTRHLTERGE